jgi:hypothetical protein
MLGSPAVARAGGIGLTAVCAVMALALLVPAVSAAQPVVPESVSKSSTVPANGSRSLTLRCPGASVALNGSPTSLLGTSSVPGTGPRAWTFRFTAGAAPRSVGAVLRCVRLELPAGVRGVGLVVGTRWSPRLTLVPASSRRVELSCRRGQVPTGWGIERLQGAPPEAVAVAAAVPTAKGVAFRLVNTGAVDTDALVLVRCLERRQHARNGQTHRFATRIARFEGGTTHSCRPTEYSLAAGASLDPVGDAVLRSAYPTGTRGGRWAFGGASDAPPVTSLVCLSRRTLFR